MLCARAVCCTLCNTSNPFLYYSPAATYTWRRIEPDGSMHEITSGVVDDGRRLRASEHGTYECAAHNTLGVARARRTIIFDGKSITLLHDN